MRFRHCTTLVPVAFWALVLAPSCAGGTEGVAVPGEDEVPSSRVAPPVLETTTSVERATPSTSRSSPSTTTTSSSVAPSGTEPASTIAPPDAEVVYYRAGDEDPAIVGIQEKLVVLGYLDDGAYTPGLFDRATNDAVVAFQSQYGVLVDGVVGPETRRSLAAAAASVTVAG